MPFQMARCLLAAGLLVALSVPAAHGLAPGGGSKRRDCLAVFDAVPNDPARRPRHLRCTDGEPCDADGSVNGVCDFRVGICANSSALPRCSLRGVDRIRVRHAQDNGDPDFDPEFQSLQAQVDLDIPVPTEQADVCSAAVSLRVPIRGPFGDRCRKGRKRLHIETTSIVLDGRRQRDRDRLKLTCDPAPGACDARVLFSGTFDRIQRQIFSRSCALSGCHDSQARQGGLLLERGASLTNLIDVLPNNSAALQRGWRRVTRIDATAGDPSTSFLFRKLTGRLDGGLGERMPADATRLNRVLREVVELWIRAGAPATGWVPGTD